MLRTGCKSRSNYTPFVSAHIFLLRHGRAFTTQRDKVLLMIQEKRDSYYTSKCSKSLTISTFCGQQPNSAVVLTPKIHTDSRLWYASYSLLSVGLSYHFLYKNATEMILKCYILKPVILTPSVFKHGKISPEIPSPLLPRCAQKSSRFAA